MSEELLETRQLSLGFIFKTSENSKVKERIFSESQKSIGSNKTILEIQLGTISVSLLFELLQLIY